MSDLSIFLVGAFTFLLLTGGLAFTVLEVRRLGSEADARGQAGAAPPSGKRRG